MPSIPNHITGKVLNRNILVTGAAGFIGFHLIQALMETDATVVGIDNINDYYSQTLKLDRLRELGVHINIDSDITEMISSEYFGRRFQFKRINIENRLKVQEVFDLNNFDVVIHLAAQAGVRYSIEKPEVYIDSNISGFLNILECMKKADTKKLIYASSSSVYGLNQSVPYKIDDKVDKPISIYAATKRTNELFAHVYSHLYNIQTIGLRFFTVYGPWGRPDMAPSLFADAILKGEAIKIFNHGKMKRDFTYINDIIQGILIVLDAEKMKNDKCQLYNIGSGNPQKLEDFIKQLEKALGKKANKVYLDIQQGDVLETWADMEPLNSKGFKCQTSLNHGILQFANWFKNYHRLNK
jgi:UDP-glucuronate 4-epimerase